MNKTDKLSTRRSDKGFASVELTFVLPVLLLIMFAIYELTQVIQANSIIINLSREAAHLVSRSPEGRYSRQDIMDIIATTSTPLDLTANGVIYISKVVGRGINQDPRLEEQHKWVHSGITTNSDIWGSCSNWTSGKCVTPNLENDNNPVFLTDFAVRDVGIDADNNPYDYELSLGETVYVVEVFYQYAPLSGFFLKQTLTLRETTYL